MSKSRGIVDPWRKVDPLLAPERAPASTPAAKERIDIEDIDLDADLAVPGRWAIRTEHVSIVVTSTRVAVPRDALVVLIECVLELTKLRGLGAALRELGVGARLGDVAWNEPGPDVVASTLKAEGCTLWFALATLDQGMLALARLLRVPEAAAACKKRGIVVMHNA